MGFHVGQRVVCVRAGVTNRLGESELVKGRVYTVRWTDGPDVRLLEVIRQHWLVGIDPDDTPFAANRFRPIDESRIDQFRAHLAPAPKQTEPA